VPISSNASRRSRLSLASKNFTPDEKKEIGLFIDIHALERLGMWAQSGGQGDIQDLYRHFLDQGAWEASSHWQGLTPETAKSFYDLHQ